MYIKSYDDLSNRSQGQNERLLLLIFPLISITLFTGSTLYSQRLTFLLYMQPQCLFSNGRNGRNRLISPSPSLSLNVRTVQIVRGVGVKGTRSGTASVGNTATTSPRTTSSQFFLLFYKKNIDWASNNNQQ